MPRGRSSKAKRVDYVADFETTTKPDADTGRVRVWGWGIARVDTPNDVLMRHTLEEFIDYIARGNAVVYFHNLRFDGNFILYWLLTNGYEWTDDKSNTTPKTFTTLISDMGRWYSMNVRWENGNTVEFRDSLNKLPMSLSRVASAFKLPEGKGEIDYHKERPVGYVMDDEERDYLRRDVTIIATAIQTTLEQGMEKLTVASDSMAEFKHLFGNKNFARMFPTLPLDMDAEIRKAYRGGFTYADPRYTKRRVGPGLVLDVNSLYPHIMYSSLLPYGEPEWVPGKVETSEEHPLTVFSVTFTATIKPGHIPCIQIKGSSIFLGTQYQEVIEEPTTLVVTNVDWDLWNEHYDIEVVSYEGGWRFHGVVGLFDEYIDKWSEVKANSVGGLREIAKLHLNSLYGRFGINPNVTSKWPELKNDRVGFNRGTDETRPPVYVPMAVFITSYARALTIRAAQDNYDCFAYADTDSLHLLTGTVPVELEVHPTRRGAWKLEYHFAEAMYIRPKAYMEQQYAPAPYAADQHREHGEYVNRIAGVPERVSGALTFADLYDGAVFHGKLKPMNVPGGQMLVDTPYQMKF